ncbi:hypothetical protein, partial [Pectobacterium sp. B2J-2]|uniref:hypothetical protein n=1 Tax=Pectobacterium sp. B2J-2 TaxID=3385372 RepID=UPI0038FCBA50
GQRQEAKYCWQASSLPNFAWNSRRVFGNDGRAIPYTTASGLLKQPDKHKPSCPNQATTHKHNDFSL